MISKEDFMKLVKHLIQTGKCSASIDMEAKYTEFIEARSNSDFINDTSSDDARYDAEMDLIEELIA